MTLATELAEAELRLTRIYGAIELGTVDVADPTLKQRIAALSAERDRLREALDYARATRTEPVAIDPEAVGRFARLVRERLLSGDVAARKAYWTADERISARRAGRDQHSDDLLRQRGTRGSCPPPAASDPM